MNAVQIIEKIPFLGGKISQLHFVVAKESTATVVEAEWKDDRITVKIDTQERGIGNILEQLGVLFGHQNPPDLFWLIGPSQYFCWLGEKDNLEEVKKEIGVHVLWISSPQ